MFDYQIWKNHEKFVKRIIRKLIFIRYYIIIKIFIKYIFYVIYYIIRYSSLALTAIKKKKKINVAKVKYSLIPNGLWFLIRW